MTEKPAAFALLVAIVHRRSNVPPRSTEGAMRASSCSERAVRARMNVPAPRRRTSRPSCSNMTSARAIVGRETP